MLDIILLFIKGVKNHNREDIFLLVKKETLDIILLFIKGVKNRKREDSFLLQKKKTIDIFLRLKQESLQTLQTAIFSRLSFISP